MDKKELTILVVSYDGYSDVWPGFFACFNRFWPDCPYEIVLSNNEKEFSAPGLRVIHCGHDAQWSTRTRMALERIDSKYVCFMLEDFFLSAFVKTERISDALALMERNEVKYYKLFSFTPILTSRFGESDSLRSIPASLDYGISLLAAIWDREYFLSLVGEEDYDPWRFEAMRIAEARSCKEDGRIVGVYDPGNPLHICHMIVQGKYLPAAVRAMCRRGVVVDTRSRPIMRGRAYLKYRIKKVGATSAARFPFIKRLARRIGYESISGRYLKEFDK